MRKAEVIKMIREALDCNREYALKIYEEERYRVFEDMDLAGAAEVLLTEADIYLPEELGGVNLLDLVDFDTMGESLEDKGYYETDDGHVIYIDD